MRIINTLGACLATVYIIFLVITKQINPAEWASLTYYLASALFVGLFCISLIIQRGLDKNQREVDKYFEDHTHE